MIQAHTLDAWTRGPARTGRAFDYTAMLGGFAAPLFLWLAGVGVAMSAGRLSRRGERPAAIVEAVTRRGLEIFVLAFLFRLQAFVVSPGSYAVTLFRVDILNIMGPAMVASGIVWGLAGRGAGRARLVVPYAGLAFACAMITPIVRTAAAIDSLPTWLQWYMRPAGDYTTFTLFPWTGFVLAGAACGVLLENARDDLSERHVLIWFAVAGAALIGLGFATAARPSIYAQASFWTSSPTYFAIRIGSLMIGLAGLAALSGVLDGHGVQWRPLERLGRSSLFIYWIHVELVYGYATWPLRHRLPLWGSLIAFTVFSVLMYRAVLARDRLVDAWQARQRYREAVLGVSAPGGPPGNR